MYSKWWRFVLPMMLLVFSTASADLIVNEIMQNPGAVGDNSGEWFEVYNSSDMDVDMNGWTIRDNDNDSFVIENGEPLFAPAMGYLVFSNNGDFETNGGVNVDYVYTGFSLANSADEVVIQDADGEIWDEVWYDGGPAFPDPNGASMYLISTVLDNNVGSNWAEATQMWDGSLGDFGSPGSANEAPTYTDLMNGGFEMWDVNGLNGPPDYWTMMGDGFTVWGEDNPAYIHGGEWAARATQSTLGVKYLSQNVYEFEEGTPWQFSLWVMDDALLMVDLTLAYFDADDNQLDAYASDGSVDNVDWQQLAVVGEVPMGTEYATVTIRVQNEEGFVDQAFVAFDDAELVDATVAEVVAIMDIQLDPEAYVDTEVIVEGIVTQPANSAHVGYADVYIQEETGYGINLYDVDPTLAEGMDRGDLVRVTGTVLQYFDVTEITGFTWELISEGNEMPAPLEYTTGEFVANAYDMEGSWATITGILQNEPQVGSHNLFVDDGSGEALVRINGDAQLDLEGLHAGAEVTFWGVIDPYQGVPQIAPSLQQDVMFEGDNELISIEEVQTNPDLVDTEVVIQGIITQAGGTVHVAYTDVYIQDESGYGVNLYSSEPEVGESLLRGDLVRVTGTVGQYFNVTQVADFTYELISQGNPLPAPIEYTTGDFNANALAMEGSYATVRGLLTTEPGEGSYNLMVDDGSGEMTVRINGDAMLDLSMYTIGSELEIYGTIDEYQAVPQLQPSEQGDIIEVIAPDQVSIEEVQTNPELIDMTVTIEGVITQPGNSVHLAYTDVYIQDESGYGVMMYAQSPDAGADLMRGDRVIVTGVVDEYNGVTEIVDFEYELISQNNPMPVTIDYTTGDFNANALTMEGTWATVTGMLVADPGEGSYNLLVNDGTGDCIVRINADAALDLTGLLMGDEATFYGTIDLFQDIPQLQPSLQEDIVVGGGPMMVTIEEVQTNPDLLEQVVMIEGIITQPGNSAHVGYTDVYIQDETGYGVMMYSADPAAGAELMRGDLVTVTGTVDQYFDVTEIIDFTYELISQGNPLPAAIEYTTGDFNANALAMEGSWAMVSGTLMNDPGEGSFNLMVDDGSGECVVRINGDTGIDFMGHMAGDMATFYGTIDAYQGVPQLQPSLQEDVMFGGDMNTLTLQLAPNYFELISTNIAPMDLDAAAVFGGIESLAIAYQSDGGIFLPPNINTIGEIDVAQGYQLFCTAAEEIVFEGAPVEPDIMIHLNAGLWQWLGYPLQDEVPVDIALAAIEEQVAIVMNDEGHIWLPPIINTIGNMVPGTGYFVFMTEEANFQYGQNMVAGISTSDVWDVPEVEGAPTATGLPYAVILDLDEELIENGAAIIELYDGSTLVGKAAVDSDRDLTPVIAWQGDSDLGIDGFEAGNKMSFRILDAEGNKLPIDIAGDDVLFGKGAYASVAVSYNDAWIPKDYAISSVYPNPFNPTTTIQVGVPEASNLHVAIFNILGEEVAVLASRPVQTGYHTFSFNGSQLTSGIYFVQAVVPGKMNEMRKIMLVK
ncbi:lamin tail domain-containing protein [bacterium]|nr:lamin tail domain-containing protein [bacterium]